MSSVTVVKFQAAHLSQLGPDARHIIDNGLAPGLEQLDSVSVLWGDVVMLCGGIGEIWNGRGHVWCVFNERSRENFVPVFRAIGRWLRAQLKGKYRRIEMSVDYGLGVANRRAALWGFKMETERAVHYLPDGRDATIYSMVRGD